jgi:O-antigen/teichoic acid export membrane protein
MPFLFFGPIIRAYYQGRERIRSLSAILIIEPFLKVIFSVSLVLLGFGLLGATFSLWVGSLFIAFLIFPIILKKAKPFKHSLNLNKSFFFIFLTSILIMLFLYLDLFFVKYYLGSEQAGYYNIASITSKVLFYAAGGITLVFLPKSSKLNIYKDKMKLKGLLVKSILLLLPIFIIFMLFPTQIISTFYTEKYLIALKPFVILSIGMFALGIFQIFLNLLWSQRMERFPLILSAIVVFADILLLNYLIPAYGLIGASVATASSAILFLLPSVFVVRKYLRM